LTASDTAWRLRGRTLLAADRSVLPSGCLPLRVWADRRRLRTHLPPL